MTRRMKMRNVSFRLRKVLDEVCVLLIVHCRNITWLLLKLTRSKISSELAGWSIVWLACWSNIWLVLWIMVHMSRFSESTCLLLNYQTSIYTVKESTAIFDSEMQKVPHMTCISTILNLCWIHDKPTFSTRGYSRLPTERVTRNVFTWYNLWIDRVVKSRLLLGLLNAIWFS